MPTQATPALLHVAGYVTGATLYAMLLVLLVRAKGDDRLARGTALAGLGWNVGELAAQGAQFAGALALAAWASAIAYASLGLLAAVVVHSVSRARDDSPTIRQRLAACAAGMAYASAGLAGLLHLRAAARGAPLPSAPALDAITIGLAMAAVPLVIVTRRQDHGRRALWMSALAVFGVSALHLGRFHGANESWLVELVGHHASIPLAFAMLYRDYRFALADLFLKRGLTLLVLVTVVLAGYAALAPDVQPQSPAAMAVLLAAWVATAWLFPTLRRLVDRFVDRVVLGRVNYADLIDRVTGAIQEADTIDAAVDRTCRLLAPALSATSVCVRPGDDAPPPGAHVVIIPTADAPHLRLVIGPLTGGRRLLSDDVAMLDGAARQLARRIDAFRMTAERYDRMLREREMAALATEAELRALRAQINPHFLFNALTTIGYLIQEAPSRAKDTLLQLTTLLRAVLKSDGEFTSLGREREILEAYLRIEHARFEDRLTTTVDIPAHLHATRLPALIVQPLVENAVKHGVAPSRAGGHVSVTARMASIDGAPGLTIEVTNTGAPLGAARSTGGVGLDNVARRLAHAYAGAATFSLARAEDGRTVATLTLPITGAGSRLARRAPTGSDQ